MVPAPRSHTTADPFAPVTSLGPHGETAATKLRTVDTLLRGLGASADAAHMRSAAQAVERGDLAVLERMVVAGHALPELSATQHAKVRRVVGLRNACALLPLLITWGFLGWASWSYHRQLSDHPELTTEPFLVLWQQRFGHTMIPTFAETAMAAFGVLSVVLVLTIGAHRLEGRAERTLASVGAAVDDAMDALAVAVQSSSIKPPVTAEEWAEAAQRVLTETQGLLRAAVADTRQLATENRQITQDTQQALAELRLQSQEFVAGLAEETRDTLAAVQTQYSQVISLIAEEAKAVLLQAGSANQQVIEQQMTPLFEGFRASLEDYRTAQRGYRASTTALADGVTELTRAATVLAGSSQSYVDIATSIDRHLQLIEKSQDTFVVRVAASAESMTTAAGAMHQVTQLMDGRLRGDLEALARDVVAAGSQLAVVDRQLATASGALAHTARELHAVVSQLMAVTSPRRRGGLLGLFR